MLDYSIFSSVRVLVAGDVMLDRYWFGRVDRISPEAPVPVLNVAREEARAGGAANVAHNVTALGASCVLLSSVGNDDAGRQIESIVRTHGVDSQFVVDEDAKSIVKLRLMAQNQQLLRSDFDDVPSDSALSNCLQRFKEQLNQGDVVILSDYGKGNLRDIQAMIELAKQAKVPVLVDQGK